MIFKRSVRLRISLTAVLVLVPVSAQGVQGTPLAVPGRPTIVSVAQGPQPPPGDVSSDTIVTWKGPLLNLTTLDDGGTPITGYQATVMSGTNFDVPIAASCAVPPNNSNVNATYTCTLTGLGYGKTYKIQVVANNAVGSSQPGVSASFLTPSLSQTVTISGTPTSKPFGSSAFALSGSATSGLTITWSSTTTQYCSIGATNGVVNLLAVGVCSITAFQDASGSHYADASASTSFQITGTASATVSGATSVTANSATLNARVPFPGSNVTPTFCISTTNSTASCALPSGVSIGAPTPSVVTSSSSTTVSALVSGLQGSTTYYYWVKVTGSGPTVTSATSSFQTLTPPTLTPTGPPGTSGSTHGTVGVPLSVTISASSGNGAYSNWAASSLPTGMVFTSGTSSATISGTPSLAGGFTSRVSVTDDLGTTSTLTINFIIDPAPSVSPSPTPTPTGTPTGPPSASTILARVEGAVPVTIPLPNSFPTSVIVLANGVPTSVRGVAAAKVIDGFLKITPLPIFSGKISLPITITNNGVSTSWTVLLTVNPGAVTTPTQIMKNGSGTTVTWDASRNAIGYEVFVNSKLVCTTLLTQCLVLKPLGPRALTEIIAIGGDGTLSLRSVAVYSPSPLTEVSAVNFGATSTALDAQGRATLLAFVDMVKAQGFSIVNIVGHVDTRHPSKKIAALAAARAKATLKFLSFYLDLPTKIVAQGAGDPIASTKTKVGQAANRRVALLVTAPALTPTLPPNGGVLQVRVEGSLTASVPLPNLLPTSVVVIAGGNPHGIKGVSDASVVDSVLKIIPLPLFSGLISMPLTVTTNGVKTSITISLTVAPAPVVQPMRQLTGATSTTVSWLPSPNASGYEVRVSGKLVCTTELGQCVVPGVLGPKSKIEVVATGGDGISSVSVLAAYTPGPAVEISAVNFAANSTAIDSSAKSRLLGLVALVKAQGFTSVTLVGHVDSLPPSKAAAVLATARAKATLKFLAKYLKVSTKIATQSAADPIASEPTKAGQAANRRVAVLVR